MSEGPKALHQQTQKYKLKSYFLCFWKTVTRDSKSNFSAFIVFAFSIFGFSIWLLIDWLPACGLSQTTPL